ncbi:MAG: methyltransferase domain-containing protein [Betaproteobacteria bacterium]|nr:methyltransferase domain-containing protein [Betaproteobacteria bacterium]MDH5219620.1 methyltransferase domain-containing protein [Betaproteobacteria bacterium]MDH5350008.1 methyltransferase domain-containing protein [Betaproteobacteria bacterium]
MSWDPAQYLRFAGERMRPAVDLLARIGTVSPASVVDLGCGAGNLAPLLLARWPQARLTGVDSSPEMLARARTDHPGAFFELADIGAWRPHVPADVVYSNAALHWLVGHEQRIVQLLEEAVTPGGTLAVQMPRNFAAPSHACIVEAIEQGPWRAKLEPHLRREPVAPPAAYWRLLEGRTAELQIWETEYLQVLVGENPVAEYTKGSWLKQFLDRLEGAERTAFEADYRRRVLAAYPPEADGRTLFPFRRLFIVARRR